MGTIFSKSFERRVGGVPPPPALGSDALPPNVTGSGLLDNGIEIDPRSADGPVSALAVAVSAPGVAGVVSVAVYLGDEDTNTWSLAGTQDVAIGTIVRYPVASGPGSSKIFAVVIATPNATPNGVFRILFTADQAARPIPEDTAVRVTGPVTVVVPNPLPVSTSQLPAALGPGGGLTIEGLGTPDINGSLAVPMEGIGIPGAQTGGVVTVQGDPNMTPLLNDLRTWLGSPAPTVGQKTGAASVPVVPASDVYAPGIFPPPTARYVGVGISSGTIKAGAGRLWTIYALRTSAGAANTWIMIFNALAAGGAFTESLSLPGLAQGQAVLTIPSDYTIGISWGLSSSPTAFVASAVTANVVARYV